MSDLIPEVAVCHVCGRPMKVECLSGRARALGCEVPEDQFVIACCGHLLTLEDDDVRLAIRDLLLAYHAREGDQAPE